MTRSSLGCVISYSCLVSNWKQWSLNTTAIGSRALLTKHDIGSEGSELSSICVCSVNLLNCLTSRVKYLSTCFCSFELPPKIFLRKPLLSAFCFSASSSVTNTCSLNGFPPFKSSFCFALVESLLSSIWAQATVT